jgi:RimJ/RimL family protein N-acetyltransferase
LKTKDLWATPVTLTGRIVQLVPLSMAHIPGLTLAGRNESIWKYMLYANLTTAESMSSWVQDILQRQQEGTDLAFTVIHLETGQVAGATRYLEMRPLHRSLEVGGTWYSPDFQGTLVNPECKYLMLEYAFEKLNCIRVQFKADVRNQRSIRAIEKMGAICEGILRNHYILQDGTFRDSVFYSILDREWPTVKKLLKERLSSSDQGSNNV